MRRALAALLLAACGTPASAPVVAPPCESRGLALPDDPAAQAWAAVRRDAFVREARFREALEPGTTFAATRIDEASIEGASVEALFGLGETLFELRFDGTLGASAADLPTLSRVHRGARGGPDARHCAACHRRGGPAGAGDAADVVFYDGDGDAPSSGLPRDAPALVGAGVLERVAAQITATFAAQRAAAIEEARRRGTDVRAHLTFEGIDFGVLVARPDGTAGTDELVAIDTDLVVRPFGRTGRFATLREAIEDELLVHLGLETDGVVADGDATRSGPAGGLDPDGDGVSHEITDAQLALLVAYVALAELPIESWPTSSDVALLAAEGRTDFDALGCSGCHVPALPLDDPRYAIGTRTLDLSRDAAEPRLAAGADGRFWARAYTDLRRHDVGTADARGSGRFVTPPLWGLMRSGPYLHDGRAPTVEDAILLHGGEAQAARDAYAALSDAERAPLRVFLAGLTRARRIEVR